MSALESALARSRLYTLFAHLYRAGLTPDLLPLLAQLPGLAEHLPHPFHADEAAAEHYQIFGRAIPPHQSLFLDPSGLLGGAMAESVESSYRQLGFAPARGATGPDEISEELALLAFLAAAEADAWADGLKQEAERVHTLQQGFLVDHLLRWIFPFALAVQQENSSFFGALAELTVELTVEQSRSLDFSGHRQPDFALPRPPEILQNQSSGLREIADYLTCPPLSGVYLSQESIRRVARSLGLPAGFGSRAERLEGLLRSAAQYEQMGQLSEALHALWDGWHADYDGAIENSPHLRAFIHPWQAQTGPARQLLVALADASPEKRPLLA